MNIKNKKILIPGFVFLVVVLFSVSYFINFPPNFSKNLIGQVLGQKPVISDLLVTNITQTQATVYWKTDIKSSTEMLIGTSVLNLPTAITQDTPVAQNGVLLHKVILNNLTPCTRYFFRAKATSEAGVSTTSAAKGIDVHGCGQLTTGDTQPPQKVQNVQAANITENSVTITWDLISDPDVYAYAVFGPRNNTNNGRQFFVKSKTINSATIAITPGLSYFGEYGQNGLDAGFMVQAVDTSDNYSEPSDRVSFTAGSVDCQSLLTHDENFSAKLNPTGNPIGGGECYTNLVNKSTANFVVNNKETLKQALATAISGQIIYVEDTASIDLTGEQNLVIPGGVTLASGRGRDGSNGALLYSNSYFTESQFIATFKTGGPNVRVTGLRLRGPNPDILDHAYASTTNGVANGIRSMFSGLEVDNNEIYAWDKWAVWLYVSNNAHVHHNHFHENIREGYGYSVWVGGSGSEIGANSLIEANLFRGCRHCVASSGHENSWEARYNVLLKRQLFRNFDRHNKSALEGELGGRNTTIFRNLFLTTQVHFGLANPLSPEGFVTIRENWFKRTDMCSAGIIGNIPACQTLDTDNVALDGNMFNGQGVSLPVASISASTEEGTVPMTVNLSGSANSALGNKIVRYDWHFGNGDAYGDRKTGKDVVYTFSQPGIYKISLTAFDAYGIPSEAVFKTIKVKPQNNAYVLSAWIKDSYVGNLTGKYTKQFLINGNVVWEDDVSGNEGWQHVVVDVSSYLHSGTQAKIAYRLYSKDGVSSPTTEIVELTSWLDDITVFGTNLVNPDFEISALPWKQTFYSPPGQPTSVGSGITTADSRSGETTWRFEFGYKKVIPPGVYGELYQMVTPN